MQAVMTKSCSSVHTSAAAQHVRVVLPLPPFRPSPCLACQLLDATKTSSSGRASASFGTCSALRIGSSSSGEQHGKGKGSDVGPEAICAVGSQQGQLASQQEKQQDFQQHAFKSYFASQKFASVTRLLMVAQPQVRVFISRVGVRAGPIGLLFFIFGLVTLVATAVRQFLANKVKNCTCCKGYGIVRCTLCSGTGAVGWSGKLSYKDGCPMCMSKRYCDCPDCGGLIKRSLFQKVRRNNSPGLEPAFMRPRA